MLISSALKPLIAYPFSGLQRMIQIMHWVVRSNHKTFLLHSESISISVDDRADFRVVRYRCSFASLEECLKASAASAVPASQLSKDSSLADWSSIDALVSEGLLGVLRSGQNVSGNTIAEHDRDKSEKMAESIVQAVRQLCSDMEGNLDEDAFRQICSKIRRYASDQGASAAKSGQILSQLPELPSMVWLSADMAHQVRIASKDPLHAMEAFQRQWERLFSARHALVPDIQYSEVWRARLIAAQKQVLKSCASQGADISSVLHTFSFAKQRFDSTCTPLLKYCCMIRAIALLCAMQAADDTRLSSEVLLVIS